MFHLPLSCSLYLYYTSLNFLHVSLISVNILYAKNISFSLILLINSCPFKNLTDCVIISLDICLINVTKLVLDLYYIELT